MDLFRFFAKDVLQRLLFASFVFCHFPHVIPSFPLFVHFSAGGGGPSNYLIFGIRKLGLLRDINAEPRHRRHSCFAWDADNESRYFFSEGTVPPRVRLTASPDSDRIQPTDRRLQLRRLSHG